VKGESVKICHIGLPIRAIFLAISRHYVIDFNGGDEKDFWCYNFM